jgi:hypothetical protein
MDDFRAIRLIRINFDREPSRIRLAVGRAATPH